MKFTGTEYTVVWTKPTGFWTKNINISVTVDGQSL